MKPIHLNFKMIPIKVVAVITLVVLLSPLYSYRYITDDTATLQAKLNAGDVTLPANSVYHVTGLSVTHNLNLNGSTLNMTAANGPILRINAPGITITTGFLKGTWAVTSPGGGTGTCGVSVSANANNVTLNRIYVNNVSSYGIVAGPVNNLAVTSCKITNTGYIGFFYDAETANTTGGKFTDNVIDRSAVPASSVTQAAVAIRGSTNNGTTTSNWTIYHNVITMPAMPTNWTGECMEIRYINNTTVSNNTFTGGSIGLSVVRGTGVTVTKNKMVNSQLEGIEFADSFTSVSKQNLVNGSTQAGILLDGSSGCSGIQIISDTVKNTLQECIHAYKNTSNLSITSSILMAGSRGMHFQNSSNITIANTTIDGLGTGDIAIVMDCSPGFLKISGGSIKNFKKGTISVFNNVAGAMTDNISMSGVSVANTPTALISTLQNGAVMGKNIAVAVN